MKIRAKNQFYDREMQKQKRMGSEWFVFYLLLPLGLQIFYHRMVHIWCGSSIFGFGLVWFGGIVAKNGYKSRLNVWKRNKQKRNRILLLTYMKTFFFARVTEKCSIHLVVNLEKFPLILRNQSPWMESNSALEQKLLFLYFCFYSQFLSVSFMFSGHKMVHAMCTSVV